MAEKIYIRNASGELEPLTEEPFKCEELLQDLIGQHPELLAGEQMRPDHEPLRWILIRREMPIEGWAVDHLLLDQYAKPTLVEVKRGSNRQVRREIVGQMLDYAATAAEVWSGGEMRLAFEEDAIKRGSDPLGELNGLLNPSSGSDAEELADEFWERAATNLAANRLRLLFVADNIPVELERIVKFLNEQTRNNLEVLAVEVKQYPGRFGDALVSRVIGQVEAQPKSGGGMKQSNRMKLEEFLDALPPDVRDASEKLVSDALNAGGSITPSAGGIRVRGKSRHHSQPITVAQFYAPTDDRPSEFDFRVRFDYANQELQQFVLDWVAQFESDNFVEKFTRYNWLTGSTVQADQVSQHSDLLGDRLTNVLTGLTAL